MMFRTGKSSNEKVWRGVNGGELSYWELDIDVTLSFRRHLLAGVLVLTPIEDVEDVIYPSEQYRTALLGTMICFSQVALLLN